MIITLLFATVSSVFVSYYDKKGLSSGITKIQYFFLKMAGMLPFIAILFFFYGFKFEINLYSILLILVLLVVNLTNYLGYMGVVKQTSPYETDLFLTLAVPVVYIFDILLKLKEFDFVLSIVLLFVVIGVLVMAIGNISGKGFGLSLFLSVGSTVLKGYILHYLLTYLTIPVYLLIIHSITALVIFVFFNKMLNLKSLKKENYRWTLITQSGHTLSAVFTAILAQNAVSYYVMTSPIKLMITTITSYFVKNPMYGKRPNIQKLIGAIITICALITFVVLSELS